MTDSYIGGYTKAILDVANWFENHTEALKHERLYNAKGIRKVLSALLDNRAELRETGDVKLVINTETREISKWLSKEERMKEK